MMEAIAPTLREMNDYLLAARPATPDPADR